MTTGEKLKRQLTELSRNLWWAWNPQIIKLFRDLDTDVFRSSNHNPVSVLASFAPERFEKLSKDAALRARVDSAHRELHDYLNASKTWASTNAAPLRVRPVAYLSAEFGIHESLPIYSGGLGVLAGDHLKSASDLGLPLVAVGLFYRESYFRQRIGRDGQQHAEYIRSPAELLPAEPALTPTGAPIIVEVPLSRETLLAQVWQIQVGRNRLLLLDTDVDGNSDENRQLAARLYFGDQRIRIRQELLLGVGGIRALRAAGIQWGVLHLNEGHSAFATLEAARLRMEATGADFRTCAQDVAQSTVFTTHTPVDAGHDRFPPELVDDHLEPLRRSLGLSQQEFLGLGRIRPDDHREALCMTVLAFKMSRYANGVSGLHGRITRKSWQVLWPHHREDEVPVGHITNGVHVRTWLAPAMQELYNRHIGSDWREHLSEPQMWARIDNVHHAELWETHRVLKAALVHFVRRKVAEQRQRAGYPDELVHAAATALDPEALTIGFARRFATYKRATLLFSDPDRLVRILTDPERPVQLIFAGKAHPADDGGKRLIQEIFWRSIDPRFQGRITFAEDYDMLLASRLYGGVDVWLNNPRAPLEASGTSGMKAAANGALNLSVLDGWWIEGFAANADTGWGIEPSELMDGKGDAADSDAIYALLERQVVPLFYERDEQNLPREWIRRSKEAIRSLAPRFSSQRMVIEYINRLYVPASAGGTRWMAQPVTSGRERG
jgi:glycogen phosphorylase